MQVARVLDRYTVAVNGGAEAGIAVGDELRIAENIVDPETGEVIGVYPDMRVRVTEVFPRFCVAQTFRITVGDDAVVTVNIGDSVEAAT